MGPTYWLYKIHAVDFDIIDHHIPNETTIYLAKFGQIIQRLHHRCYASQPKQILKLIQQCKVYSCLHIQILILMHFQYQCMIFCKHTLCMCKYRNPTCFKHCRAIYCLIFLRCQPHMQALGVSSLEEWLKYVYNDCNISLILPTNGNLLNVCTTKLLLWLTQ